MSTDKTKDTKSEIIFISFSEWSINIEDRTVVYICYSTHHFYCVMMRFLFVKEFVAHRGL